MTWRYYEYVWLGQDWENDFIGLQVSDPNYLDKVKKLGVNISDEEVFHLVKKISISSIVEKEKIEEQDMIFQEWLKIKVKPIIDVIS